MDIEQLEALALADDRAAAVARLIPGTADHDYFRCVALMRDGALADAQVILDGWVERHGHGEQLERLRRRHLLYRLVGDPRQAALEVRDATGAVLDHQPEAAAAAVRHPSRLDDALVARDALIARAFAQASDLSQLTDDALPDLLDRELDPARRRALLARLGASAHPRLVELVAADLAHKGSRGLGSFAIHAALTLDQLHALAAARPELRLEAAWVDAVITRMRPAAPDWRQRPAIAEAYLDALSRFVDGLAPAFNGLRAHVRYHRLDHDRRRGRYDRAAFAAYLALPREQPWARRQRAGFDRSLLVVPGRAFPATDLPPVHDESALVLDYLSRVLAVDGEPEDLAPHLDDEFLARQRAIARLTTGDGDDRWAIALGPTALAALRDRVDIELAPQNPARWHVGERVALEVDLKHVAELTVKVFRINVRAWFEAHGTDLDATIDLDGLTARDERTLRFDHPPLVRHRERIELDACDRAGVYVIELIGDGRSSRAVIRKGDLRPVVRVGVAGPVVTIADDRGQLAIDGSLWLGGREYRPRADGGIALPFSTRPGRVPILLCHGDLAVRAEIVHPAESYAFAAHVHLEREALVAGQTARALVRASLAVAGAPVSLQLVRDARLALRITDLAGTTTARDQPIALDDHAETVVEWPVPEHTAHVELAVRGRVRVVSEQRDLDVSDGAALEVATIQASDATEAFHLAHTAGGWVLSLLGRTGEPRPRRAVAIALKPRAVTWEVDATLDTDDRGRVELGALDGIAALRATAPSGVQLATSLDEPAPTTPRAVHVVAGADAVVPLPARARAIRLVELRAGAPLRDVSAAITREPYAAVARGLAPGAYQLTAIGLAGPIGVVVAPVDAEELGGWLDDGVDAIEQSGHAARIRRAAVRGDALAIELADATSHTRVHVIATRFAPSCATAGLALQPPPLGWTRRLPPASDYLSGRDLGDEYRYVLERRRAPRRPGTSLERPSLLLDPWALRTTSTAVAHAAAGGAYGMPAPAPAAPAMRAYGGGGPGGAADTGAFAGHGFLPRPATVIANLRADGSGHLRVPLAELGDATSARVVCIGPSLTTTVDVPLAEAPLAPRDLRLRLALDADAHFLEDKQITPLTTGGTFEAADLATARVQIVDTVAKVHAYLLTLLDDATLREFGFVTRWHALDDAERRATYSKYACHELHLFLAFKDPVFFAAVVEPYLAHKRVKTFVDRYLLGEDLAPYLEPWAYGRLNAVERALLASRLPAETRAIARGLADLVELVPPDPEGDARRIDTLIAGGALEGGDALARAAKEVRAEAMKKADVADFASGAGAAKPKMARRTLAGPAAAQAEMAESPAFGYDADDSKTLDFMSREVNAPLYRAADKTQEWAEHDWWHRRVGEMTADLIEPNRFWRDLAAHPGGGFLSPHVGDCAHSFAEAMCALAVLGVPFTAGAHDVRVDERRLRVTAASPCLVAWSQIVPIEPSAQPSAILVGQRYFRADDRWEWDGAEQREKPASGELIAGIVYLCRVVVSNPTGARERLAVLVQIPRGAIAVAGALPTRTVHVDLDPYGTWSFEYAFYLPAAGRWSCFPVHVTRRGALVACAPPGELEVVAAPTTVDATSWAHVSQHGTLDEVAAFLERANLGRLDLAQIAWRMTEPAAFGRITALLASRHTYVDVLWAYALVHRDPARRAEWLRFQDDFVRVAGPIADDHAAVALDPIARGWLEHLEYAPLINARAHRLGARTRILNDALDAQYRRFLDKVAHDARPADDDRLAAAHYLFTMDRADDAHAQLARVDRARIATPMQLDLMLAFDAVCRADPAAARAAIAPYLAHPVDRWRRTFAAIAALLDDAEASAPPPDAERDPDSRDARMNELAAREPTLAVSVDGADLVVEHHHLDACQIRLYPMDIELLFSRQPFVGADTGRFAFIEPAWSQDLVLARDGATRLTVPDALRAANVVVEVVAGGLRRTSARFAHDLALQVAAAYGQIRVVRASTRAALPAAYVKVYARHAGGAVAFYKDGYTDLAGRFDYATLSTDDLDRVERFAILVVADGAGATVTEVSPPPR